MAKTFHRQPNLFIRVLPTQELSPVSGNLIKDVHEGRYWIIPAESYNDIEQVYVVLQKGKMGINKFLDFLREQREEKYLLNMVFVIP